MSAITRIEMAIDLAERSMKDRGYCHGPCLSASLRRGSSNEWEIEFAYEGKNDRSQTTDPPSIVLLVDLNLEMVKTIELM
jgi:hypothetical protein